MAAIHVDKSGLNSADDDGDTSENFESENDEETSDRLSASETDDGDSSNNGNESDQDSSPLQSGMANVMARILAKDTSSSNKALLAKGKTDREILRDISKRRKERGEQTAGTEKGDDEKIIKSDTTELIKLEKRKLWESMSRRRPSDMGVTKEAKLRKIATQGMVQLFQSVHEHQKMLNQKLASVGPSERKKDKVVAEFTKGKFLDLLKNKGSPYENKTKNRQAESKAIPKWKILQDDFMMGARMKDWNKDDEDDGDDNDDNIEGGNAYSRSMAGNGDEDFSDDD